MPSNERSLKLTDAYRQRVLAIRDRVEREATNRWTRLMPQDLDAEDWVAQVAALVAQAQSEATRVSSGYLSAYLTSETGKRQILTLDSRAYAGLSRDGRPLSESLRSPIIGTKAALKEGRPLDEALTVGLDRGKRMVELDLMHAGRQSLLDAIKADDRFDGWQRALRGTCGACAGVASGVENGLRFQVHPGCQCVSEPVVSGVRDRFPRLTGAQLFAAKSQPEQDQMLGPEAAEQVRTGEIALADLVERSHLSSDADDFITQKPIAAS